MAIIDEITPNKFQRTVQRGAERLGLFRSARMHFLKEYIGPYYDKGEGPVGTAAINLIFNAVRVLVPTMVMNFPKHTVMTPYLQAREYANMLGLALDQHDRKIDIRNTYRRVIADAIFTLGILKTGLAQSDSVYVFDDDMGQESVDNGTVYTEAVDFDNFVVDPNCKDHMFRDATFMGDKISVPRKMLLDSGLYDNDLVMKLPRADDNSRGHDKAADLSMKNIDKEENDEFQDVVDIYEVWVPAANAVVTLPGAKEVTQDKYLRVADYYGVKEGPYTLLALTPPVPGNPMPVPMVGVWYDLHVLANRMAKKVIEQAERQKDIIGYKRGSADDAEEVKNAGDGEMVALDDPDAIAALHMGGQQNSNENHLQSLENWFNMMAGNPAQVGGQNIEAKSATAANILQQNSGIGLEDMRDMVYQMAAGEARKRAWYFHTDPMMKIPLTKRQPVMGPVPGAEWLIAPTMQDIQIILTPEQRSGDFLDYTFNIEPESMGRVDSKVRLQQEMAFAQQIVPAAATAAQLFMQLGVPFDTVAFIMRMAKDMGITWMDEVVYSPQVQQQLLMQQMMGPQDPGKAQGQPKPNSGLGPAMLQNGQPGQVQAPPMNPMQQQNQQAQSGANDAQQLIKGEIRNSLRPSPPPKVPSLF